MATIGGWKAAVLADSPVAAWDFQDASGSLAGFNGGTTYPLSVTGSLVYAEAGPFSGWNSIRSTGASNRAGNTSVPSGVWANLSIELWAKLGSTTVNGPLLQWAQTHGPGIGIGGTAWDNAGNNVVLVEQSVAWVPTTAVAGTAWHHYILTVGAGVWRLYVDGLQAWTATRTQLSTITGQCWVFGDSPTFSRYLASSIAGAALYNTVLNSTQVTAHYNGTLGPFTVRTTQAGLVVLETDLGRLRATQVSLVVLLTAVDLGQANSAGRGSAAAALAFRRQIVGSSVGQAATSGTLAVSRLRALVGSSGGLALASGTLTYKPVIRQLASTAPGRATVRTTLGKIRRLSGVSHGVATVPRIRIGLTKPKLLTASSAGRATSALSQLGKRKALAGSTSGRATASATLGARRALAGRTNGLATVTTFLYRPPRRDVFLGIGTSAGTGSASLAFAFRRDLVGSSAGSGAVAPLLFGQSRPFAAIVPGVGTCSAWLALTAVTLPLVPAQVFAPCTSRGLAFRAAARPLVYNSPARELVFTAELRD